MPSNSDDSPNENPSPELTTWGVGPWQGNLPTGPEAAKYDQELLKYGDTRNVVDKYRYWSMEAIVADLDGNRHSFHVAIENWQHDLNIGSIVRTANAFLARQVHIIGNKRWNRRGAMVTDRYQHLLHHPTVEEFVEWSKTANDGKEMPIIAIDNLPGCKQLENYTLPETCVLLFGQEGPGLSDAAIAASKDVVEITQFGSTRSINASAAAAITMHQWIMQNVVRV
jgi:tRNA G18 (ribose-2'-O)-methylase SpoU